MASTIILKRRIQAAQNVSKTTRAMQMIAASKLKRAQNAALASKPYVEKLSQFIGNITQHVEQEKLHPYMQQKSISGKTLCIVLSPDKGLCGGLITNLIREFLRYNATEKNSSYIVVGKKLEAQVVRLKHEIVASFSFGNTTPTYDVVFPMLRFINDLYLSNQIDSVKILSTRFNSIFNQTARITTLLPIVISHEKLEKEDEESGYLFEPDEQEILPYLVKHYVEMTLYQSLLEGFVSEQASRMIAMQNATDNAKDIILDLRLEYNKSRQAKITSEILDISSSTLNNHE